MSIKAMTQALEALETEQALRHGYSYCGGVRIVSAADEAINALRTAIQQAEAQRPDSGEQVVVPFVATYSSESIGGKQHDTGRVNKGPRGGFFASTASIEDASLIADALNAYTHPARSVFLVRDVASLLGASVPDVCNALTELGCEPRRSTNAAISPDEALAVADHLRPAPSVSDEEPLPDLMLALHHEAIGWNAHHAAMLAARNPYA